MFDELPEVVLLSILQHLGAWKDLARIAAVNKQARELSIQLQVARFIQQWGLHDLKGWPKRPLPAFELQHFMVRHEVQKSDNFARLSLLYDCSPAIIRAANNVISDASLQSRLFIYMPASSLEQLHQRVACVLYDSNSCREHVVALAPEEAAQHDSIHSGSPRSRDTRMQTLRRLSACVSKGLRVDEDTAAFYLMEADDDAGWDASGGWGHTIRGGRR